MDVNEFYKLRSEFIIIGITGRMRGGANLFADLLCADNNPFLGDDIKAEIDLIKDQNLNEGLKYEILQNFISFDDGASKNWKQFELLEYKKVIFFQYLYDCYTTDGDFFQILLKL